MAKSPSFELESPHALDSSKEYPEACLPFVCLSCWSAALFPAAQLFPRRAFSPEECWEQRDFGFLVPARCYLFDALTFFSDKNVAVLSLFLSRSFFPRGNAPPSLPIRNTLCQQFLKGFLPEPPPTLSPGELFPHCQLRRFTLRQRAE